MTNNTNDSSHCDDKRIWSETKAWFNSLSDEVQWDELSESERVGAREAYLDYGRDEQ